MQTKFHVILDAVLLPTSTNLSWVIKYWKVKEVAVAENFFFLF
jgi:hypothetical protein